MAAKLHESHKARGFKHIEDIIAAKEGIGTKSAGAILAAGARKASAAAKAKNPRLKKVKPAKKGKK